MATLFCWEFGGGWGHLFRLRALAVEFAAKPLVFAVPDLEKAGQCLPRDAQIVKTPAVSPSGPQLTFSRNFADSLYQAGFFDSDQLSQCLTEWIELLESLQVDSIVAECAPTALLAARILGMPAVATGTGFTLPPLRTPLPSHHSWLDLPREVLLESEQRLLSVVNPALQSFGAAPLETAAQLFEGVSRRLCTLPDLDHHDVARRTPYHGITAGTSDLEPDSPAPPVFVYMSKRNRFLPGLLKALAAESLSTLAYLPGLERAERETLGSRWLTLTNQPVNINWVSRTCRFAITEGGHNSGGQLLLARIPLLICPRYLEQMLWSYRLVARELCVGVSLWSRNPDLGARISQVQSFTPGKLTG